MSKLLKPCRKKVDHACYLHNMHFVQFILYPFQDKFHLVTTYHMTNIWTKFKTFADDELNVAKIMKSACESVENIAVKQENAGYQHLLL